MKKKSILKGSNCLTHKKVTLFVSLLFYFYAVNLMAEEILKVDPANIRNTKLYMKAMLLNKINDNENHFLTQRELQETLRFIYRDNIGYLGLKLIQSSFNSDQDLSIDQSSEAERLINDIIFVENRMNEYRFYNKFHCRFALADNPLDEVPADSILKKPYLYSDQISSVKIESIIKSSNKRAVIGLCWSHTPKNKIKIE